MQLGSNLFAFILAAFGVSGIIAYLFASFRAKTKDETISAQASLITVQAQEIAQNERYIAKLEGQRDVLSSDFAGNLAQAIVSAIPAAFSQWETSHQRDPHARERKTDR